MEFDRSYRCDDTTEVIEQIVKPTVNPRSLFLSYLANSRQRQSSRNIFDNLPALQPPKATDLDDELDRYLKADPEQTLNALQWWIDKRSSFPRLSRMALDYLAIPGE